MLHTICQQIWKTQQWLQDWKRSVFIPVPKKGNTKECSNYHTIVLISHASKVMLKILQDRLQQYVNHEFPDVQAGFRKDRGTRDQIASICWIIKKEFQKNIYCCFIDYAKAWTVWITTNCGKFFKRWDYQTTLPASWEICMQVSKQQLRTRHVITHWFQVRKGICQGYVYVCSWQYVKNMGMYMFLTYVKNMYIVILLIELKCGVHHAKCQAGWNTSWNQDCQEKYR